MVEPPSLELINRTYVRQGRRVLSFFGGCDYFRFSSHSRILAAIRSGLARHGLSVAASRRTTGNHALYRELETALAAFFRAESAVSVNTGYASCVVAAQALAGNFSHALLDAGAHVALQDAALALGCPIFQFAHRDPVALAAAVARCGAGARPLVLTDGMFPHDGSVAPLRAYLQALPRDGWLLVDDAHGAGTLGEHGRGTVELAGVSRARVIQCLTLSKAFGVFGGAVLGPRSLRERILARSRQFIGSTPLPLPLVAGCLAALKLMQHNRSRRRRLQQNTARVRQALRAFGWLIVEHPGPIIALPRMARPHMQKWTKALLAARILPPLIQYPGGPPEGFFRFVISSEHAAAQIHSLVGVLETLRP